LESDFSFQKLSNTRILRVALMRFASFTEMGLKAEYCVVGLGLRASGRNDA